MPSLTPAVCQEIEGTKSSTPHAVICIRQSIITNTQPSVDIEGAILCCPANLLDALAMMLGGRAGGHLLG